MKATELMIGDWVYDNMLKGYGKIEVLTPFAVQCDIHTDTHHMDFFQPIPLSEEILKANNIDFLSLYHNDFSDSKPNINIRSYRDKHFEVMSGSMPLRYVHELQHALRLCGLNDLADNFEV